MSEDTTQQQSQEELQSGLQDENAFGVLISYWNIEDEEYAEEAASPFIDRFTLFERLVLGNLDSNPLAESARVLSLGHAIYVEFADGEQKLSPLRWGKELRVELSEHDFQSVCVVTHGGRWISDTLGAEESLDVAGLKVTRLCLPSEPLRRALLVDAASHGAPSEEQAWGPGMYVDTEAIEALGLSPKNTPTVLSFAGADFYRTGS